MTKHAFTIAWGLVALMLTLALLRLALAGPGGTLETLALFGMPAVMAAAMSLSHWTLRRMPPALVPAWRRWQGTYYLLFIGAMTVAQAMMVMKPLGLALPFAPAWLPRGFLVLFGVMLMVMFNRFPKLPQVPCSSGLDPGRWAKMARLNSWVVVGLGLLLVLFGLAGRTPVAPFLWALANAFFVVALLAYARHLWRNWPGARL